jgi:ATP-binding cassette subfamily B multidrug efflux pump
MMGVMMSMMIPRAAVSAGRISEVLDTESSVHQPAHPTPIPAGRTRVEFADVDFRYPGAEQPVLCGLVSAPSPVR